MKKQFLTFVMMSLMVSFGAYAASFKSAEDAAKKLATYSVADIEGDKKRLRERQELKIDEMFSDLEGAETWGEKNPVTEDLAYNMMRVSIITFIHDPSAYAVEIILPVYQKNKDLFKKAAERFHAVDRALILDVLDSHDKASSEGMG